MKKSRYLVTAAAALWMAIGLGMTAQAKSTYMLEIANQYDSEETSRDGVSPIRTEQWLPANGNASWANGIILIRMGMR